MSNNMEWHSPCKSYLERVGAAEYLAQKAAWKHAKRAFRFSPTEYMNTLIGCLNRNEEENFKVVKMVEGRFCALGF